MFASVEAKPNQDSAPHPLTPASTPTLPHRRPPTSTCRPVPTCRPIPAPRRTDRRVHDDQVYRNTYVCNLCLLTLTVSFAADLYPGAPSHNVPMSAALLWACSNVDDVRALRRRSFAYALSVVVLMSLFMDVDFLASDLKVRVRSRFLVLFAPFFFALLSPLFFFFSRLPWSGSERHES